MVRLIAFLSLLVAACQPVISSEDSVEHEQGIVNGTYSTLPSVVRLSSNTGECSGTLVGPSTVLTAAHCFLDPLDQQNLYAMLPGQAPVRVANIRPHRGFGKDPDTGVASNDLAIVTLERPVRHVRPIPISGVRPQVGTPITIVGYGGVSPTDEETGIQRTATSKISSITGTRFAFKEGGMICDGDSGGPAFAYQGDFCPYENCSNTLVQIGVHSQTTAPFCEVQSLGEGLWGHVTFLSAIAGSEICHKSGLYDPGYCSVSCPCKQDEGHCDDNSECDTGYCAIGAGPSYGESADVNVCKERPSCNDDADCDSVCAYTGTSGCCHEGQCECLY